MNVIRGGRLLLFEKYDTDRDGHISVDELHAAMVEAAKLSRGGGSEELSEELSEDLPLIEYAQLILDAHDVDGNGNMELDELFDWLWKGSRLSRAAGKNQNTLPSTLRNSWTTSSTLRCCSCTDTI